MYLGSTEFGTNISAHLTDLCLQYSFLSPGCLQSSAYILPKSNVKIKSAS